MLQLDTQFNHPIFEYDDDMDLLDTNTDVVLEVTEYGVETHLVGCESGDSSYILAPFSWYEDTTGKWS